MPCGSDDRAFHRDDNFLSRYLDQHLILRKPIWTFPVFHFRKSVSLSRNRRKLRKKKKKHEKTEDLHVSANFSRANPESWPARTWRGFSDDLVWITNLIIYSFFCSQNRTLTLPSVVLRDPGKKYSPQNYGIDVTGTGQLFYRSNLLQGDKAKRCARATAVAWEHLVFPSNQKVFCSSRDWMCDDVKILVNFQKFFTAKILSRIFSIFFYLYKKLTFWSIK